MLSVMRLKCCQRTKSNPSHTQTSTNTANTTPSDWKPNARKISPLPPPSPTKHAYEKQHPGQRFARTLIDVFNLVVLRMEHYKLSLLRTIIVSLLCYNQMLLQSHIYYIQTHCRHFTIAHTGKQTLAHMKLSF